MMLISIEDEFVYFRDILSASVYNHGDAFEVCKNDDDCEPFEYVSGLTFEEACTVAAEWVK